MQIDVNEASDAEAIAAHIQVSLVKSLYEDPRTMSVGASVTVASTLATAVQTGEAELWVCVVGTLAISLFRLFDVKRFASIRFSVNDHASARYWEARYATGASAYVFSLGVWCLISFTQTNDPGVQLLAISMTLVNMIGAAGRNFGSRPLVVAQLISAGVPILLGLLTMGSTYYMIAAFSMVPFFWAFYMISDRLRNTLTSAVTSAANVEILANKLNAALNNMAHGLCVIDASGNIVLCNTQLSVILRSNGETTHIASIGDLMRQLRRQGLLGNRECASVVRRIKRKLEHCDDRPVSVFMADGRTVSIKVRPMLDNNVVAVVEDISDQVASDKRIRDLAHFDYLTQLPNRVLLQQNMIEMLSGKDGFHSGAVFFIDLDCFKQVNDSLGHRAGDALLCCIGDRLRAICGEGQVVSRFGGDEFVIFASALGNADAESLAARIIEGISRPCDIGGQYISTGASIGIAFSPRDGRDPDQLLCCADLALYEAKRQGRGTFRLFDAGMKTAVDRRRALENDLRRVLTNGELALHYQPIYGVENGRAQGAEALLRWDHPEFGLISPCEFISLAENIGMIGAIGKWVLGSACGDAARLPTDMYVSINLSPYQFHDGSLYEDVMHALTAARLAPSRLQLEITEDLLLQECPRTMETIESLRKGGVKVVMDDFGTGYSSLSYLRTFQFDKIKIDRSFVAEITTKAETSAIVLAAVKLAGNLGLQVTAEGVETESQMDALRAAGCDEAQGFLLGRPQTFDWLLLAIESQGSSVSAIEWGQQRKAG